MGYSTPSFAPDRIFSGMSMFVMSELLLKYLSGEKSSTIKKFLRLSAPLNCVEVDGAEYDLKSGEKFSHETETLAVLVKFQENCQEKFSFYSMRL
jgi:hypothetical protein